MMQDTGYRIHDTGYMTQDTGYRTRQCPPGPGRQCGLLAQVGAGQVAVFGQMAPRQWEKCSLVPTGLQAVPCGAAPAIRPLSK
jgi:hypothetical protein